MTLNSIMTVTMRYFTEFGSFPRALRKSGWRHTNTFCGRKPKNLVFSDILFIAIFAEVTENKCIMHKRSQKLLPLLQMLLTHYYFQIQLQVWFHHDEISFKLLLTLNSRPKLCYFVLCVVCTMPSKKSSRSLLVYRLL